MLFAGAAWMWGAESAASILQRCAAKLTQAPSVSAEFSIRNSDGEDISGKVVMARECFRLSSPVLNIWFDGHTQWAALSATREVNVTEPTGEELLASNPFAIITSYASRYNARLLPAQQASSLRRIELTPNATGGDIRKAVITIDTTTYWPVKAVITMASGSSLETIIKNCSTGVKLAAATFVYKKDDLPGYELVDLR